MTYSPSAIARYFDQFGDREWARFEQSPLAEVQLEVHQSLLKAFVERGSRVLEIGAGPGRFTNVLHELSCQIVVGDISPVQLALNRQYGQTLGFASSVEAHLELDICDLSSLAPANFDAVVAFGGPLSYVFDRRDEALQQCKRVLRPRGLLVLSVMSMWGTLHRHLAVLRDLPIENVRRIVETGDLTAENEPASEHHCHLYRAEELRDVLERNGFRILALSASNALSTNLDELLLELRQDAVRWDALLQHEKRACVQPGFVDGGTHLIAIAELQGHNAELSG